MLPTPLLPEFSSPDFSREFCKCEGLAEQREVLRQRGRVPLRTLVLLLPRLRVALLQQLRTCLPSLAAVQSVCGAGGALPTEEMRAKKLSNAGVVRCVLDFDNDPRQPLVEVQLLFGSQFVS